MKTLILLPLGGREKLGEEWNQGTSQQEEYQGTILILHLDSRFTMAVFIITLYTVNNSLCIFVCIVNLTIKKYSDKKK